MGATSGWSVLGQGILGAVMGGANAAASNAERELKTIDRTKEMELQEKVLRDRAAFLEKLRSESEQAKEERQSSFRAKFYADTAAQAPATEVSVPYTDAVGSEEEALAAGGKDITKSLPPSRRGMADFRLEQARLTGNKALIDQAYGEAKDIRAEEEQERKRKADEAKALADQGRIAVAERMAAAREQMAATGQARLEAMVAGLIGQGRPKSDLADRKYDAKQWSDAKKELATDLVIDDPIKGSKPDHVARYLATAAMRRIQAAGDVDPADAATLVGEMVSRVREKALAGARGDQALYQKLMNAGMAAETNRLFQKTDAAPRSAIVDPFAKDARPTAPQPQARPTAKTASGNGAAPSADSYLAKATEAQLWAALEKPETKAYALEELRRRGLIAPAEATSASDGRFFQP